MSFNLNLHQSTLQHFYFVQEVTVDNVPIQNGDIIAVYKRDTNGMPTGEPVGGSEWTGEWTDIVTMGNEGNTWYTANYMNPGELPAFRVYINSSNMFYDVSPDNITSGAQGNSSATPFEDGFCNVCTTWIQKLEVLTPSTATGTSPGKLGGDAWPPGSGDMQLNVNDVTHIVAQILNPALPDEVVYHNYPHLDLYFDGTINVMDVQQMIFKILDNPSTTSAESQILQRQISKLDKSTKNQRGNIKPGSRRRGGDRY